MKRRYTGRSALAMNAATYKTCVIFIEFAIDPDYMLVGKPFLCLSSPVESGCVIAQVDVLLGCEGERLQVQAYCISSDFPTRLRVRS